MRLTLNPWVADDNTQILESSVLKKIVVLASELFTYYVINVYVPRVRANADQVLTTPPRVSRDPKKC